MAVPVVTSLTPDHGLPGDVISVHGSGFTGATAVNFYIFASLSFSVVSDSLITAEVPSITPAGANNYVEVVNPDGTSAHTEPDSVYLDDTGSVVSSTDCVTVNVPTFGFVADGVTPDGDGVVWTVERIDGWWDSAPVRVDRSEVPPTGEITTAVRENGRAIVLWLDASSGQAGVALGAACFAAMDSIDNPFRSTIETRFEVVDPVLTLHAQVRRVGQINKRILGELAGVQVQIPLLAPDPYRYDSSDNPFD